jgi:RNA polymerase sigma-70 factor, ECF subfamily
MATFEQQLVGSHSYLKSFAYRFSKDEMFCEDLVQETVLKALENTERFQEGTNMKGWLFTIMRNIFINQYRKKKRFFEVENEIEEVHSLCKDGLSVDNLSDNNFLSEYLDKLIGSMSEDIKQPFDMHFKGFKYQEIAEEMSLPIGTVKSRIFHARKKMQERMSFDGVNRSFMEH